MCCRAFPIRVSAAAILAFCVGFAVAGAADAGPAVHGAARLLFDELLKNPSDAAALESFRTGAAALPDNGELRTRLAAVYALGLFATGDSAAWSAINAVKRGELPSDVAELLNEEAMTVQCPACSGGKWAECQACRGQPACKRCGGKGWIPAPMSEVKTKPACPSCRGTGSCTACMGKGRLKCSACMGLGRLLSREKARERYLAAIALEREYALEREHPEMLELRAEMDKARKSMDIDEAIEVMKAALARYSTAGNEPEARKLLQDLENDREEAANIQAAKRLLVENAGRRADHPEEAVRQVPAVVGALLKAFARGETGAEYWTDAAKARRLFTPVSWHVGRSVIVGSFAQVPAAVEADGVGPDAVRQVVFYLECRNGWKVTAVETRTQPEKSR
jgi:hypothetical protein